MALFHAFMMKSMFLCKSTRPGLSLGIYFLSLRVNEPTIENLMKLARILAFLKHRKHGILILHANNNQYLYWYIDTAFAYYIDIKGHADTIFALEKGAIMSDSTKQKSSTRSSIESELARIDEKILKILQTLRFIKA